MDWSRSVDVGLCFGAEHPERDGALYMLDAQEAGTILIQGPYRDTLDKWQAGIDEGQLAVGYPLLFCPVKQQAYQRAKRQEANYLAQFDFRMPLEDIWEEKERVLDGSRIYMKLVLPAAVKADLTRLLGDKGVSLGYLLDSES